jgi:tRNA pseudouridine38-40 synthase
VHAFQQVAVFQTRAALEPEVFLRALNAHLPTDIRIITAVETESDFHPRYRAAGKTYAYLISRKGPFSVFLRQYSWQVPYSLDLNAMSEASRFLIGRHDFTSFRASGCSTRNPVRTVRSIEIIEENHPSFLTFSLNTELVKIRIHADAFLRYMVRNIVGTLVDVGRGRIDSRDIARILSGTDRRHAGITAPACGLFLESIDY